MKTVTITEAAELLGVSRQSVGKRIGKLGREASEQWTTTQDLNGRKITAIIIADDPSQCPEGVLREVSEAAKRCGTVENPVDETEESVDETTEETTEPVDKPVDEPVSEPLRNYADILIAELQRDKEDLRRQLEEANRRNSELTAQMGSLAETAQKLADQAQQLQAHQQMLEVPKRKWYQRKLKE